MIWNRRKQKVGRAFSCNGVGSSLDLFMCEGIFIKDLKGVGGINEVTRLLKIQSCSGNKNED